MSGLKISQQRRGNAHIQGFAPNRISSVSASLDTSGVLAYSPLSDVTYKINNIGESATLLANSIRVVGDGVVSINFTGTTIFEIMDM